MTVSATTVTQYYTGIFRQAPTAAVQAGYQAMATDAAALNSMLSAANIQVDPVVRLYQTAFNRLPDPAGMTAWVVPFSTNAITLQQIANGFTQSTEFTTLYPTSMSNAQFVGALYWNILQRAGEDAGIRGWTNALDTGALTRAQVLLGFSDSAEFVAKIEPNVNTFLTNIANTPIANQGASSLYSGSLFDVNGGGGLATTYNLTVNADGPGAIPPALNTTGTNGANLYNGVFQTTGGNDTGTFNTVDNIAGGTGTDTVAVRITAAAGSASTGNGNNAAVRDQRAPVMTSVETVLVSNIATGANATAYAGNAANSATGIATINFASTTGLTRVGAKDSSSTTSWTEFAGVAAAATLVADNADGNYAFNISGGTSRTGTTDAFNLVVANGSGTSTAFATVSLYSTLTTATTGTTGAAVQDNTFEVANIATSGAASYLNLGTGGSLTTITVTGTGAGASTTGYALDLADASTANANFAVVRTINLSGMTGTGGAYIRATGNNQDLTFTGSSQNDRLDLGVVTNLTSTDSITFGTGTDTLGISTATGGGGAHQAVTAAQKVLIVATGAEQLAFTNANFAGDSLSGYTGGPTTFIVEGDHSGAGALSVSMTGMASAQTLRIAADITATAAGNNSAGGNALTVAGGAVGTIAKIALTGGIDLLGSAANGAVANNGLLGGGGIAFGANITSLVIDSSGSASAAANTISGAAGSAAAANGGGNGGDGGNGIVNGTQVQNITITGNKDLTISGAAGGAKDGNGANGAAGNGLSGAASVDATAFTGLLQSSFSSGNDVVLFGTGGSKIDASLGGDSWTFAAGRDQLTVSQAASNVANAGAMDTLNNFTVGTDKFIVGAAPTAVLQGASYTAVGTGVIATDIGSAITAGINAAGITFAANNVAIVTVTGAGAGTYLVVNDGNAGFSAAQDAVVKLVGTTGTISATDFATTYIA